MLLLGVMAAMYGCAAEPPRAAESPAAVAGPAQTAESSPGTSAAAPAPFEIRQGATRTIDARDVEQIVHLAAQLGVREIKLVSVGSFILPPDGCCGVLVVGQPRLVDPTTLRSRRLGLRRDDWPCALPASPNLVRCGPWHTRPDLIQEDERRRLFVDDWFVDVTLSGVTYQEATRLVTALKHCTFLVEGWIGDEAIPDVTSLGDIRMASAGRFRLSFPSPRGGAWDTYDVILRGDDVALVAHDLIIG